jgi:DNA processing protein
VLDRCTRSGVELATIDGAGYPALLRQIDDPPLVLFYKGCAPSLVAPAVAVVGSRRASRYGTNVARELAGALAGAGLWVVSGLALGIDGVAQAAALARGRSAAVLAGGAERATPRAHHRLYTELVERGCVMSEYPPGTQTLAYHFPIRNRIITGLCVATIVVEAGLRSGSLISARLALEQGRDVFAVPGNIDSKTSAGTNRLIADGCAPAVAPAELLADVAAAAARLGVITAPVTAAEDVGRRSEAADIGRDCDDDESRVLAVLETTPMQVDAIAAAVGLDQTRIMTLLTALELDGRAQRLAEGAFVRAFDLTLR